MDELSDDERAALADTRRRAEQIAFDVGPFAAEAFLCRVLYDARRNGARPEFIAEIVEDLEEYGAASTSSAGPPARRSIRISVSAPAARHRIRCC